MKPTLSSIGILLCMGLISCRQDQNNQDIPLDIERASASVIPIEQARQYQANFISARDSLRRIIPDTTFLNLPNAETFTRDAIILLLNQKGADSVYADGIRLYYGKDEKGVARLVLLPVDKSGRDIQNVLVQRRQSSAISIPGISTAKAAPQEGRQAIENGQTCPPCLID